MSDIKGLPFCDDCGTLMVGIGDEFVCPVDDSRKPKEEEEE